MAAATVDGDLTLFMQSMHAAAQNWASFDWNGKRAQFDAALAQSKEAREQSLAARKHLAESTKQLKRTVKSAEQAASGLSAVASSAVDGLARECKTTVRSYQEEIDHLTRRCKQSESCFGDLVRSLSELPDPAAMLAACAEQMRELSGRVDDAERSRQAIQKELDEQKKKAATAAAERSSSSSPAAGSGLGKEEREELVQLRREVSEYEVEFRSLKNQDITIRKLEAKVAELQVAGQEQLQEQLEKAKEELAETEGRRAAEALEREAAMERKVQTLELQLKAERAGAEATQAHWLEADEGVSQREAAWEAQKRILVDDAERLRESLQAATRERDELRLRVAALEGASKDKSSLATPPPSGVSMTDLMLERKAYEAEVAELSETATILREELRLKEESIQDEKRELESKIETLEREKSTLQSTVSSLESRIAEAPSPALVESMKRELRILKRLEYNADDVDADRDPEIAGRRGGAGGGMDEDKDLESVLVAKLHRAESDLVTERVSKSELTEELNSLRRQLADAKTAQSESERLVASLEKDLERAIASSPLHNRAKAATASVRTAEPALAEENPATLQSILDPDGAPPPAPPQPAEPKPSPRATASEKAQDDHSVATIVMAQRDRLRARCDALEAERDSFKRELQAQVQASESLKTDNTKLYEKVRYLQNYNKNKSSSSSSSSGRGGAGLYQRSGSGLSDRDLDLEALEQRYEASVDPFRQFSKAERQRKLQEMSPMERTVFIVAKTVLSTKEMRTALFFYVVALHLLVFITTYHWSHAAEEACPGLSAAEHLSHMAPHAQVKEAAAAGVKAVDGVAEAAAVGGGGGGGGT